MEKKVERLQLRLTKKCKERLYIMAATEGKSMAEFLEELINAYYHAQVRLDLAE